MHFRPKIKLDFKGLCMNDIWKNLYPKKKGKKRKKHSWLNSGSRRLPYSGNKNSMPHEVLCDWSRHQSMYSTARMEYMQIISWYSPRTKTCNSCLRQNREKRKRSKDTDTDKNTTSLFRDIENCYHVPCCSVLQKWLFKGYQSLIRFFFLYTSAIEDREHLLSSMISEADTGNTCFRNATQSIKSN